MHLDIARNAPMNDFIEVQVVGFDTEAKVDILCDEGVITPERHIHPRIVHDFGLMKVLSGLMLGYYLSTVVTTMSIY